MTVSRGGEADGIEKGRILENFVSPPRGKADFYTKGRQQDKKIAFTAKKNVTRQKGPPKEKAWLFRSKAAFKHETLWVKSGEHLGIKSKGASKYTTT